MSLRLTELELVPVEGDSFVLTVTQYLMDMLQVLLFILVERNDIINDLPDALYPTEGFIHPPVVVFADG